MLHRLGQRFRLQHHALTAPKWPVVDGAMPIVSELSQIMHANAQQTALDRTFDHAMLEDAGKKSGEDGDDVEAHGHYSDSSPSAGWGSASRSCSVKGACMASNPGGSSISIRLPSRSIFFR